MNKDQDFYWHENAGARVLLPSQLIIQSPFPELYAKAKNELTSIIVTITSHRVTREASEGMIGWPPRGDDQQVIDILRQGEILVPYRGFELILEERVVGQPLVTYGWLRILYLDEISGAIADFHVQGAGLFRDAEPVWQKVMDSFSWDRESAIVLKFDGDEAVHRARYVKKRKKRRSTASMPPLPASLHYLQPIIDELAALSPEEANEDLDISALHDVLRQRVHGLSLAKAETRLANDQKALEHWIEQDRERRQVVRFILPIIHAFEFVLGDEQD